MEEEEEEKKEEEEKEEEEKKEEDGMHSKRVPTHRGVVGNKRGIGKLEPRVDLNMGRKTNEIP